VSRKTDAFRKELSYIKDVSTRTYTEEMIEQLPDYFFTIPASSTGKYHPSYATGDGGLLRHTKAAVGIAVELFRLDWWHFSEEEKDYLITSLILHDGWKSGKIQSKYTLMEHPLVAVDELQRLSDPSKISNERLEFVTNNISTHMGQWNRDYRTKKEVLPKPEDKFQKFVHLADYLASRKCLEFNFEVDIARD